MSGARWPGENGVPPGEVAGCPHFPECFCTEACMAPATPSHLPRLLAVVLLVAIVALGFLSLWIGFSMGAAR